MAFPYLLDWDTELTLQMLPTFAYIIKFFGFLFLKHSIFLRMKEISRLTILTLFLFFEFLRIGSLHTLINTSGLDSYVVWINIFQDCLFEIIGMTAFLDKLIIHFLNSLFYKNEKKKLRSYENFKGMYYGMKSEIELFSLFIYIYLISTKYYEFSNFSLVDCLGRPTLNMSPIKQEHFFLFFILLFMYGLQELIDYSMRKYTSFELKVVFINISTLTEKIAYIVVMVGITNNFAIPGLYSMMYKKEI